MNIMRATPPKPTSTWLRTDHPVVPVNPSTWEHLREVETALHLGVTATADTKRPGFFELEVGDNWYYIHIPSRIAGVYLVAVGKRPCPARQVAVAHQCA
jgi:hypothetical protein